VGAAVKSIFAGAGYFWNDDRPSGGELTEDDVIGCSHCQRTMKKTDWRMQGGMCFVCSKPLCLTCFERT
jgi:predicted nucleic acid-binding Zn ribbon protein